MTSRRVGRPCAKTAKPKTIKIKIKKEPKTMKIKIKKEPMMKKEIPRLKKVRKAVKKPPPVKSELDKVRLLNSSNRIEKKNLKDAQKVANFKERAKLISAKNRQKVAIRRQELADKRQGEAVLAGLRSDFELKKTNEKKAKLSMKQQIEKEIKMEESRLLANLRANAKINNQYRKNILTKFQNVSYADMAKVQKA
jgi:hypothetical protein